MNDFIICVQNIDLIEKNQFYGRLPWDCRKWDDGKWISIRVKNQCVLHFRGVSVPIIFSRCLFYTYKDDCPIGAYSLYAIHWSLSTLTQLTQCDQLPVPIYLHYFQYYQFLQILNDHHPC